MQVVEGSHQQFHDDSWKHIESLSAPSHKEQVADEANEQSQQSIDFGAVIDEDIADATKRAEGLEAQGQDASYAHATIKYLKALQLSYRDLQANSPHLTTDLLKDIGEARACRELCSEAASHDTLTDLDTGAIYLALKNVSWARIPTDEGNKLFDSLAGTFKKAEQALTQTEQPWAMTSRSPVHRALSSADPETVRKLFLYSTEDEPLSAFARYIDGDVDTDGQLIRNARFFIKKTQPGRSLTEMQDHPVIARLVDRLGGPAAAKVVEGQNDIIDLLRIETPKSDATPEQIDTHNAHYEQVIQTYLASNLGLSRKLIRAISSATKSRLKKPLDMAQPDANDSTAPTPKSSEMIYMSYLVTDSLLRMGENIRKLGVKTIERLHSELGVVNLDRYIPEDLQTMQKLLDKDPATIEQLQNGDVMAVMCDAYGDYNGAFNTTIHEVRRESGRSLPFEIAKPSDLYRHMLFLKQRGIKPSSLNINAHGRPGMTNFGSSTFGNGFYLSADQISSRDKADPDNLNVSLLDANLARLFSDEFFQPSRGVDDAGDWQGSIHIVINSCSSDVASDESTRSTAETIATAIAKTADREKFSVYGATGVLYVENTPMGLRFKDKDNKGIGVRINAEVISPSRKETILGALKLQKRQDIQSELVVTRTNYAVIPISNKIRTV